MWLVVGAIGPLIMVLVWFAILGEKSQIGGYDRGDFIIYYVLMTFGWYIVGGEFSRPIGREIRNGDINKSILKPYSVVFGAACSEQAWKLTSLIITMPVFLLIIYFTRDYISWNFVSGQWFYIFTELFFAAIIFGIIQAMIGILAFWVTEIWPFADAFDIILHLLGGMLAPIALLPLSIQKATEVLPFRYIFYEPIELILGNQVEPTQVILKQIGFVAMLFVLYKLMWRAGIRRYEGIGG